MKKKIITLAAIIIGLPLIGVLLDACNLFGDGEVYQYYEIKNICTETENNLRYDNYYNYLKGDDWNFIDTLIYNDIKFDIYFWDSTKVCAFINPFIKSCLATNLIYLPKGNIENIEIFFSNNYSQNYTSGTILNEIFYKVNSYNNLEEINDYIAKHENCSDRYFFRIKDLYQIDTVTSGFFSFKFYLSNGKDYTAIFPVMTIKP